MLSSQPELRKIGRLLFLTSSLHNTFPVVCYSLVTVETLAKKEVLFKNKILFFTFIFLLLKHISKFSSRSGDGEKLDPITFTKKSWVLSPPFGFGFLQVEEKTNPGTSQKKKRCLIGFYTFIYQEKR